MNEQRLMSLLGLAQKAGKIASGEMAMENAVKTGKARLLLIAADASANTRKGHRDLATYYQVTYHEVLSKEQLGNAIGKPPRAALAVIDAGFSKTISETVLS
jgi:ribosomal protein L7Ae-like RNA K-turn-binding protein